MSEHPWLGRWWSVLSKQWLEVVSASSFSVRIVDARGAFDLEPMDVRHRIESRLWVREQE